MNATHVVTVAVWQGAAALALAQDAPSARPAPGTDRLVVEVVSSDARTRILTVRVAGAEATRMLPLSARAAGQAGRYKAGDRVELTCAAASPAPGSTAPGQVSPGPAPAGTGAAPGTGSTGVGTTGTGISGTGTPAPGTTGPAAATAAERTASQPPCGVVTSMAPAPAPAREGARRP